MRIEKASNGPSQPSTVDAARCGLIPASDDVMDEAKTQLRHAWHLIRAMRRIAASSAKATDERIIIEILADLRYYCAVNGSSFEQLDLAAVRENDEWRSGSLDPSAAGYSAEPTRGMAQARLTGRPPVFRPSRQLKTRGSPVCARKRAETVFRPVA